MTPAALAATVHGDEVAPGPRHLLGPLRDVVNLGRPDPLWRLLTAPRVVVNHATADEAARRQRLRTPHADDTPGIGPVGVARPDTGAGHVVVPISTERD